MLLLAGDAPIGGFAVKIAPDGALEARLALLPERRTPEAARRLVRAAWEEVQATSSTRLRLTIPVRATWARDAANAAGLTIARSTLVMLHPAGLSPLATVAVPGIEIRPINAAFAAAEEQAGAEPGVSSPVTEEVIQPGREVVSEKAPLATSAPGLLFARHRHPRAEWTAPSTFPHNASLWHGRGGGLQRS